MPVDPSTVPCIKASSPICFAPFKGVDFCQNVYTDNERLIDHASVCVKRNTRLFSVGGCFMLYSFSQDFHLQGNTNACGEHVSKTSVDHIRPVVCRRMIGVLGATKSEIATFLVNSAGINF